VRGMLFHGGVTSCEGSVIGVIIHCSIGSLGEKNEAEWGEGNQGGG